MGLVVQVVVLLVVCSFLWASDRRDSAAWRETFVEEPQSSWAHYLVRCVVHGLVNPRRLFIASSCLGLGFLFGSGVGGASMPQPVPVTPALVRLAICAYVATDIFSFMTAGGVTDDHTRDMALLFNSLFSLALGTLTSGIFYGWDGLRCALDCRYWVYLFPVAICFALAQWSQLNAIARLSPVFVKVLSQLKLPCTVLCSTLLLKKRYSIRQFWGVAIIFLGATAFTCLKYHFSEGGFAHGDFAAAGMGLLCCLAGVGFNVLATTLGEKSFRMKMPHLDHKEVPLCINMVHLKTGECLISFLLAFRQDRPLVSSTVRTFDIGVWLLMICMVLDSWISATLVKVCCSVTKYVVKCASLVGLYSVSVCILRTETVSFFQLLTILAMMFGMWLCFGIHRNSDPRLEGSSTMLCQPFLHHLGFAATSPNYDHGGPRQSSIAPAG